MGGRARPPELEGRARARGAGAHLEPAASAARPRVWRALEARLAHLLEEERDAAPVRVRARAPVALGHRLRALDRRVVQHPERALAGRPPGRVRAGERAGLEVRARDGLEEREDALRERVRAREQLGRGGLELVHARPAARHRALARGDLQALLLVGEAGRRPDLRKVLVARVEVAPPRHLRLLGLLGLREEAGRRTECALDHALGYAVVGDREETHLARRPHDLRGDHAVGRAQVDDRDRPGRGRALAGGPEPALHLHLRQRAACHWLAPFAPSVSSVPAIW